MESIVKPKYIPTLDLDFVKHKVRDFIAVSITFATQKGIP